MLVQLAIRDIVLIDRLELNFRTGLSVLTGETGAGKSILLDAFALALGGRGDGRLVRHGEAQGVVTAVFDLPVDHPARRIAGEAEIDTEGDLILRRTQMADGRTRAFVNDQPVGVQVLRAIGAALVEIHGQHDDRALSDPASHRAILDAFGGLQAQLAKVGAAARAVRAARAELAEHRARVEAARKEADFLRHAVDGTGRLDPHPGEEAQLAERRSVMQQSEKVARELNEALDAVGGPHSGVPHLSAALRKLERRAAQLPALVDPCVDGAGCRHRRPRRGPRGAGRGGRRRRSSTPATWSVWRSASSPCAPRRVNTTSPADDLAALAERYGGGRGGDRCRRGGPGRLGAGARRRRGRPMPRRREKLSGGRRTGGQAARRRGEGRTAAAQAGARPVHHRDRHRPGVAGSGRHRPGRVLGADQSRHQARPDDEGASGGELSRFMLALKVVLADKGSAPTLIFDEIDTGVGGAVADAIGLRLARLAATVQVVAVTHAPQVAARAETHFLIAKAPVKGAGRVATRVSSLPVAERRGGDRPDAGRRHGDRRGPRGCGASPAGRRRVNAPSTLTPRCSLRLR